MKKLLGIGLVAAMVGANAAQAYMSTFNVYYSGDAGGQTMANKSWVDGVVNIDAGVSGIGGGITVTLPNVTFDAGPTKNYGNQNGSIDNTLSTYGLGNNSSDWNAPFSASIVSLTPMVSVSLYLGAYEIMTPVPFTWTAGADAATASLAGWAGTVVGTWSAGNTVLTLSGAPGGQHIFGGTVQNGYQPIVPEDPSVPEPGTIVLLGSLLGLGTLGGLRKRFFGAKKSVVA